MEAGWLTAGGRPILWTTEQRSFTAIPAGEDVLLQPAAIFTRKNRTAAHLCDTRELLRRDDLQYQPFAGAQYGCDHVHDLHPSAGYDP